MATHWAYFAENPGEIGLVWRGGLSYHGVLIAGLLGTWGWLRWQGRSFGYYADLLAPALALASSFGWLACYLAACAYGRFVVSLWRGDGVAMIGRLRLDTILEIILALISFLLFVVWQRGDRT